MLAVIDPQILQVLSLLGSILESSKQDDIVLIVCELEVSESGTLVNAYLVVCHAVTTSSRGSLALGLETSPFSRGSIQMPEIIVMIERTLFGG